MAKEQLVKNRNYHPYKDMKVRFKKEGEFQILTDAKFIGLQTSKFDPDKSDFVFEMGGEEHVLNHSGHLKYQVGLLKKGDIVDITYKGTKKLDQGLYAGKESHQFAVAKEVCNAAKPSNKEDSDEIPF